MTPEEAIPNPEYRIHEGEIVPFEVYIGKLNKKIKELESQNSTRDGMINLLLSKLETSSHEENNINKLKSTIESLEARIRDLEGANAERVKLREYGMTIMTEVGETLISIVSGWRNEGK